MMGPRQEAQAALFYEFSLEDQVAYKANNECQEPRHCHIEPQYETPRKSWCIYPSSANRNNRSKRDGFLTDHLILAGLGGLPSKTPC